MAGASQILSEAPIWDVVDVRNVVVGASPDQATTPHWDESRVRLFTPVGSLIEVVWPHSVTLYTERAVKGELSIQPHLNTAIAAMSLRRGWQALHAGAFEVNGKAWGLLGAQGSGKSSLLASMARLGFNVVTDDLLVISDDSAFAGPRCIDLRADAAKELGLGTNLGFIGYRELWRMHLSRSPLKLDMAGFVIPTWGELVLQAVPRFERLRALVERTSIQGIGLNRPENYLKLASLPMFTWSRPKSWGQSDQSLGQLVDRLSQIG